MVLRLHHLLEGMESLCFPAFLKKKKGGGVGGNREKPKAHHSLPPVQLTMTNVQNWKGKEALHTAEDNIQRS